VSAPAGALAWAAPGLPVVGSGQVGSASGRGGYLAFGGGNPGPSQWILWNCKLPLLLTLVVTAATMPPVGRQMFLGDSQERMGSFSTQHLYMLVSGSPLGRAGCCAKGGAGSSGGGSGASSGGGSGGSGSSGGWPPGAGPWLLPPCRHSRCAACAASKILAMDPGPPRQNVSTMRNWSGPRLGIDRLDSGGPLLLAPDKLTGSAGTAVAMGWVVRAAGAGWGHRSCRRCWSATVATTVLSGANT
jgi:hypothetical protein